MCASVCVWDMLAGTRFLPGHSLTLCVYECKEFVCSKVFALLRRNGFVAHTASFLDF